jgi:DNA-binding NarL/FixJ family response regulator
LAVLERAIHVLVIEDNSDDFEMLKWSVQKLPNPPVVVRFTCSNTLAAGLGDIARTEPDVLLLDLKLPDSDRLSGLDQVLRRYASIPVIVLTGLDDYALGIDAVQRGAEDYLVKGRADGDLIVKSVQYAIERKRLGVEREQLIAELKEALDNVKTLSGLLPICAGCKKIKDETGDWQKFETYVSERSDAEFTHCLCPACHKRLYPDIRIPT